MTADDVIARLREWKPAHELQQHIAMNRQEVPLLLARIDALERVVTAALESAWCAGIGIHIASDADRAEDAGREFDAAIAALKKTR